MRSLVIVLVVIISWAGTFPSMKIAFPLVPPFQFMGIRYLLAAVIMFVIGWFRKGKLQLPHGRELRDSVLFGFLQTGLMNAGIIFGILHLSGGITSVLAYTHVLMTAVLASLFLSEKFTSAKVLGLSIGFAGVVVVFWDQLWLNQLSPLIIASSASVLGAALCWAAATVFFKKRLNEAEKLGVNAVQLVSGGLTLVAISLFVEKWQVKLWPAPALWSFVYLVLPATVIAWTLWLIVLGKGEAINTTVYLFLVPAFAIILSGLLLKETISLQSIVGTLAVIAGIILVSMKKRLVLRELFYNGVHRG